MLPARGECRGQECPQTLCRKLKGGLRYFSFLADIELDEIADYFNCCLVAARNDLWRSGESDGYLAFIISGRIEIKVDTEFPGKQVVVGVFSRGSVIGTSSVLDGQPRSTTARALEDVGLVLLTRENFEALLAERPALGIKLLKGVLLSESRRLSKAYARLASLF